jgi:hypothetical protein
VPLLLVLDDDPERARGFAALAPSLGTGWTARSWADPAALLDELEGALGNAGLIALECDIAAPVVARLAARKPACPVTLHWRNRTYDAAWGFFRQLWAAGWLAELVYRFNQNWAEWHHGVWLPEARDLLHWRGDTAANRAHAASCELLKRQFEGREAIYVEKYVRRVRVSHIRAQVDAKYLQARAEEILTPGLGAPPGSGQRSRWRFGGGAATRFSSDSWSLAVQHVSWSLYFAPEVIERVVQFAATLPPEEVFESARLQKLIWELSAESVRAEKPVFPE